MQGFLNVYKPKNVSSAFVVNKIKKHFNIKKVGHLGTLDPLAVGVLPLAIGKATRLFDYFLNKNKEYIVNVEFGYETNTLDIEGEIIANTNILPSKEQLLVATSGFIGSYVQIPPKFSAKHINGKRAYELARHGVEFELTGKEVKIYNFILLEQLSDAKFKLLLTCSSGTYVRSVVRDLAYKLNSLATMTDLERTKSGVFNIENSVSLEKLLTFNTLDDFIIKIEEVLPYETYNLNDYEFNKLKNGLSVIIKEHEISKIKDGAYILKFENKLLGIGEMKNNTLSLKTYLLDD